jgi:hypothetical protein
MIFVILACFSEAQSPHRLSEIWHADRPDSRAEAGTRFNEFVRSRIELSRAESTLTLPNACSRPHRVTSAQKEYVVDLSLIAYDVGVS